MLLIPKNIYMKIGWVHLQLYNLPMTKFHPDLYKQFL